MSDWAAQPERGAPGLTRAGIALIRRFGWSAGRPLARAAASWFFITSPAARAASRDYLGRIMGHPVRTSQVAHHFDAFATAILDRVMLACGRADDFQIDVDGLPALLATLERPSGAILLGAHLGSFEILRTLAANAPVPVWALMYRRNGGALTALLDQAAPALRERIIEIGDTTSMLLARECLDRGEMVGMLADRCPSGHRTIPIPFLGSPAPFPAGPLLVAATLGAPVFLCYAIRTGPRHYRIGIEPFADRLILRREHRAADLTAHIARYAAALERLCHAHPYQWFNFFPFWTDPHAPDPARPVPASPSAAPRPG
jgi:predicted LPLAT superfamily acyltransferase